ncbi:ArsR/SmtB family transcription factor [Chloroflexota bacterium]
MEEDINIQIFELQASICKSLSDSKRLLIIHELRTGEKSVGQLTDALEVSQPNMSRHLSILRESGLVVTRRAGTTIYYSLTSPKIVEACDIVRGVLTERLQKNQELAKSLEQS